MKKFHFMSKASAIAISVVLAGCTTTGILASEANGAEDTQTVVEATTDAAETVTSTAPDLNLDYDAFTLDNGLRVVVHEDRKAPVVAVSIWYGVGSKDEPKGKTGFAHLFEHLMFNGSENYNDEWFRPLEEVGATGLNGTTWLDRTNYFQTVPTPALDRVLWMESDRMGHLLGAIDQDKLDEQRGVVQNEKRQGDNQPYGLVFYAIAEGLYPEEHPYAHSTIGSMEDLEAASLDDVYEWFETYYGAANTVLVLAGDIDAETARPMVEKYFGDIDAGPPLQKATSWLPDRVQNTSDVIYDAKAPQARIYRAWAVPDRNDERAAHLYLAASILGDGKNSRLFDRFVYSDQTATGAASYMYPFLLSSWFISQITVKEPGDLEKISAQLDDVLVDFAKSGPSADELARAKTKINADTIRGLERVGGFSGKSGILAEGTLYSDDPAFIETWLEWINSATADDVRKAAKHWLMDGHHQVDVYPYPEYTTIETNVDRSTGLPDVGALPSLTFPEIETATLENGVNVFFARRDSLPLVSLAMQFDAGYAADAGGTLGVASLTASMLDEGTESRDALEISAELERLGANISAGANLDVHTLSLSALSANLDESVGLWADIVKNANFPESELERLRGQRFAQIEQEKASPVQLALRLLPPAMYGEGHAYGVPFTGSGTAESVAAITRDDLVDFKNAWLSPERASIYVVGDTTLEELTSTLNASFGDWAPAAESPGDKNIASVDLPDAPRMIVIDQPGSPQSLILGGHVFPPTGSDNNIALTTMNGILGGEFSSRVNMNLREDKSWAYGAYTILLDAEGQRPWLVYAPVQTDRTGDSLKELKKEITTYKSTNPATETEFTRIKSQRVNELPGRFETSGAVLSSMLGNARFGRPLDYAQSLPEIYGNLDLTDVQGVSEAISADAITWIVVGDRSVIESQLNDAGFSDIEYWNADGEIVE